MKSATPRFPLMFLLLMALLSSGVSGIQYPVEVQYRNRGNRYEGLKPKPVSGYDIELISALVDYKEEVPQVPDQLKIRFYLERPSTVYLTVRELDYKYYYWMDRVQPAQPWGPGFDNIFEWPLREVVQQLEGLKVNDLGALVRLEKSEPSKVERVAPALFYYSQCPVSINGYLFTFKTNRDARLKCSVYQEGKAQPAFTQVFPKQRGGRPFVVRWLSSKAPDSAYKLVVNGYFLDNNYPIDQAIHFCHRTAVK